MIGFHLQLPTAAGSECRLRCHCLSCGAGHTSTSPSKDRAKLRSRTFPGVAHAIAQQWSEFALSQLEGVSQ